MSEINIREMQLEDKAILQDLFDVMGEESALFFNVNHGNEKRMMGYFDSTVKGLKFFLAVENNRCVGVMFIRDIDISVPWFGIAVRDGMHGRGIGTLLIQYITDYLKNREYGGLLLTTAQTNFQAQRLYEKCGFERCGVHPSGEYLYILRFRRA
ncbi:GNAT family N-acetyltransferase [Paenibacillus sp. HJGM_3]|uniref:GNAT family N-acetyltransferase n=1 Tax=Paenibacillus sp. HJGM_3 TaxID=3379816 RepID=UPI00385F009F